MDHPVDILEVKKEIKALLTKHAKVLGYNDALRYAQEMLSELDRSIESAEARFYDDLVFDGTIKERSETEELLSDYRQSVL